MKGAAATMTYPPPAGQSYPPGPPYPAVPDPYAAGGNHARSAGYAGPAHAAPDAPSQYGGRGHRPGDQDPVYGYAPPPPPSPFDLALPDLRNRAVNALIEANAAHAEQAWQRRRRDPLNPHAVLYLYAEPPVGNPPRCELRLASRLFLGADEQYLPMLLFEFKDRVREHLTTGVDPRGPELSNSVQDMSSRARYIGLAVSSLDTPEAVWERAMRDAFTDMDVPGRCYAVLADGSRLQVDRYAKRQYGQVQVISTHAVGDHSGLAARRWQLDRGHLTDVDRQAPYARDTWAWLQHLHDLITHLHPAR